MAKGKPLPMEPSLDEILAGAKQFLSKRTVVDQANDESNRKARDSRYDYLSTHPEHTYGDVARDTALAAAIPASFLGGPIGAVAGAGLAAEGIKNFVDRPGIGSGIGAALGVLPGLNTLRNVRSARAATALAKDAPRLAASEAITSARELMNDGFSHYAAGKIAKVPSGGRSSAKAISHLQQLPDEDRLATSLAKVSGARSVPPAVPESVAGIANVAQPGSAAGKMMDAHMSTGEQQGLTDLEDMLMRIHGRPQSGLDPIVDPAQAAVGDMVGSGSTMDRMFRENRPVVEALEKKGMFSGPRTIQRESAMDAVKRDPRGARQTIGEGGVQREMVDRGQRLPPAEGYDEATKRTIMFGGVRPDFSEMGRGGKRPPMSMEAIRQLIERITKGVG